MVVITERDKELTRGIWSQYVEKDYAAVGQALFTELFTSYPDYIKYFERMKSSSEQNIFESARFKKHMVSALFPSIALMLHNLDHPEQLTQQLKDIGINHKRRNLTRRNFQVIQEVILTTFKKVLGDLFDQETETAWDKILSVAFDKISTIMETTNC